MKKYLVSILLVLVLTSNAWAIFPLAYYVGTSLALHVAAGAAAIYYAMKPSGKSSVAANGDISRPSSVTWVETSDIQADGTITAHEKNITAKADLDKVKEIVRAKPTDYPLVNDALKKASGGPDQPLGGTLAVGATFTLGGQSYTVTSSGGPTEDNWGYHNEAPGFKTVATGVTYAYNGIKFVGTYTNSSSPNKIRFYTLTSTSEGVYSQTCSLNPPSYRDATPPEVSQTLADNGVSGNVKTAYQAELDKMMQDPAYVPSFSDDTTGLPYAPPPGALSQAQIDALSSAAKAVDTNQKSVDSATTAATTAAATSAAATAAASAAGAAASAAGAAAANAPGDAGLAAAAAAANAAALAANAAAGIAANAAATAAGVKAQAEAVLAAAAAEKAKEEALVAPEVGGSSSFVGAGESDKPVKKDILALLTAFAASSPLVSMITSFVVTTSDASGIVPIGNIYGQELNFDFTRWASFLSGLGGILLVVVHAYAVKIVIGGW